MNTEKINNIFLSIIDNKIVLIVLCVIVGLGLALASYISEFQPPAKIPDEIAVIEVVNNAEKAPGITNVTGRANATENTSIIPAEELPVYKFEPSTFTSEKSIAEIISNLGLEIVYNDTTPTQGRVVVATDGSKSLSAELERGQLHYIDEELLNRTQTFEDASNLEQYTQASSDYLTNLGIDLSYFQPTRISYLKLATGVEPVNVSRPSQANVISIEYTASIDKFPLIDKPGSLDPNTINVWITPDKGIFKIYIESTGTPGEIIATVPIKTRERVIEEINAGKAKIINSKAPIGEDIARTLVRSGRLGYYATEGKLLPVYILEGDSITIQGSLGESYLLIDAIDKSVNDQN